MDVKDIDASKQAYVYFLSLYHNKCRHCLDFAVEILLRTHVIVKKSQVWRTISCSQGFAGVGLTNVFREVLLPQTNSGY